LIEIGILELMELKSKFIRFKTEFNFKRTSKGFVYQYEKLDFLDAFSGGKHVVNSAFQLKKWSFKIEEAILKVSNTAQSDFF
jgi:hypothetical protein